MEKKKRNEENKLIAPVHKVAVPTDDVVNETSSHYGIVESFIIALEKVMTKKLYKNLYSVMKNAKEYIPNSHKLGSIRDEKEFFMDEITTLEKRLNAIEDDLNSTRESSNKTLNEEDFDLSKKREEEIIGQKKDIELDYMKKVDESEAYKEKVANREKVFKRKEDKISSTVSKKAEDINKGISKNTESKSPVYALDNKKDEIYKLFKSYVKTDVKIINENVDEMFNILWHMARIEFISLVSVAQTMEKIVKRDEKEREVIEKVNSEFTDEYSSFRYDDEMIYALTKQLRLARQSVAHLSEVTDDNLFHDVFNVDGGENL